MKLLLYGPPGAGKDTQGHILSRRQGLSFVSAGRLLRVEMRMNTETGQDIIPYIHSGEQVPSAIICPLIRRALRKAETKSGYVMNGFPRTMDTFAWYLRLDRPDAIVLLSVDEATVRFRLELRARFDDDPGTISHRLAVFRKHTPDIINHFTKVGIPVLRIDGTPPVGQVTDAIIAGLAVLQRPRRMVSQPSTSH